MDRRILLTGFGLLLLGGGVLAWKVLVYGQPLQPVQPPGAWQVEMRVAVRGSGEPGSVRLALPLVHPGQRVFAAWSSSESLDVSIRSEQDARIASFTGWMEDFHQIAYVFRIERFEQDQNGLEGPADEPPEAVRSAYTRPEIALPSTAPVTRSLIERLELPSPEERGARIRSIFAFVRHEVVEVSAATDDALLTMVQREGNELGRVRLLVTLLRTIGIPARVVAGLELGDGRARPRHWAEVWHGNRWISASPATGALGKKPLDWIVLRQDGGPLVEATGVRDAALSVAALRAQLSAEDVAAMMTPTDPVFSFLSLYRLSISTQAALRVLLLLPLGALLVSVLRNIVGVPSYGTFMPMLIALALRGTGLGLGLVMVAVVIAIGAGGRALLDRLRLLLVPRLSILLCLVILVVVGFTLLSRTFETRDFFAGIVFPIVILSMLIERFSLVLAEEGIGAALKKGAWSVGIAMCVYPLFVSDQLEFLMFSFPELILVVVGLLVFVGSYTGYRVSDWLRFRSVARRAIEDAS